MSYRERWKLLEARDDLEGSRRWSYRAKKRLNSMSPEWLSRHTDLAAAMARHNESLGQVLDIVDTLIDGLPIGNYTEVVTTEEKARLQELNRHLTEITRIMWAETEDLRGHLEDKVSSPDNPMANFEIDGRLEYCLREDDLEYDENSDGILTCLKDGLKRDNAEFDLKDKRWGMTHAITHNFNEHKGSILSKGGASANPGAVQFMIPNSATLFRGGTLGGAIRSSNRQLGLAVRSLIELHTSPGGIPADLVAIDNILAEEGYGLAGSGIASGEMRIKEALERALSSPFLGSDLYKRSAKGAVAAIHSNGELTRQEISGAENKLRHALRQKTSLDIGTVHDDLLAPDQVRVTLLLSGLRINLINKLLY